VSDEREKPIVITSDMLAPGTDPRVDFERGMRIAPPLVLALITANVALFAWELAIGALASRDSIVEAGALVRDRVLAGEWWRLESATFLHAGWDHLLGNCLVLYVVGMACEHAFGFVRTAIVYFTSGLAGSSPPPCRPGRRSVHRARSSGWWRRWSWSCTATKGASTCGTDGSASCSWPGRRTRFQRAS